MDQFATRMDAWTLFFSVTAGVTGTLIGLLFVALALNPGLIAADSTAPGLRVWAGQTFHSFLMVLIISLIGVMPNDDASVVMYAMAAIGVTGVWAVAGNIRDARRDPDPDWSLRHILGRFLSPLLGYLAGLLSAYLAWQGSADAISWMVTLIFFLLMSAAGNCWDLLQALGDPNRVTRPA